MQGKINEDIDMQVFFVLQNITQSIVPKIEKCAMQQTVLDQTAVVVKHKFMKCKQGVKGSIISQLFKLLYSNGESDVNEKEIIE